MVMSLTLAVQVRKHRKGGIETVGDYAQCVKAQKGEDALKEAVVELFHMSLLKMKGCCLTSHMEVKKANTWRLYSMRCIIPRKPEGVQKQNEL